MTIEEKAKAYDEALKAAVVAYKDEDKHLKATLERIFPKLKESEDERWNKEDEENINNVLYILNQLKDTSYYEEDNMIENIINWLKSLKTRVCFNYNLSDYDRDMLGAIEYCIKNKRQLAKVHITWLKKQGTSY